MEGNQKGIKIEVIGNCIRFYDESGKKYYYKNVRNFVNWVYGVIRMQEEGERKARFSFALLGC
jgi:hypothetical protein